MSTCDISPFAAYNRDQRNAVTAAPLTAAALAVTSGRAPHPPGRGTHPKSASRYPFRVLCSLFEGLLQAVNKAQQYARLAALWQSLPPDESFFPFMRLLLPQLDAARSGYQLRETKLVQLYVVALGLHPRSGEAQKLTQWKDPSKSAIETTSFSDVVFVMLDRRGGLHRTDLVAPGEDRGKAGVSSVKQEEPAMGAARGDEALIFFTVETINEFLDHLAAAESSAERQRLLTDCLRRTVPLEQKWLIRIILKDMHFRMTHQTLLAAFHPTALDKFNSTSDLRHVCDACLEEVRQPMPGSGAAGIFLFTPLRPMLASPVSAKKLEQLLQHGGGSGGGGGGSIYLEPKYDGERIMVHVDANRVMYWTRNAKNYTGIYGQKFDSTMRDCFRVGSSICIRHVTNLNSAQSVDDGATKASESAEGAAPAEPQSVLLENAIFDGELLVYDSATKSFAPFGANRTFAIAGTKPVYLNDAGSAVDGTQQCFCYMVFDIVLLNGKSLMHLPLTARRGVLRAILREHKTRLEIVPAYKVTTTQEILAGMERMLDAKLEGVIIKAGESSYAPAERRNNWVKIKPDHIAGLADAIDLVVVGGYYGTKFGTRQITHFLLGGWVNASSATPRDPEARFHTVCKVGNGFTSEELSTMHAALDAHWERAASRQAVPAWLDSWKPVATDHIPDVYVHPCNSIVLEVFGYAFVESANYRVGYTVRFPRMMRVRFDKNLEDATDLETLEKIKDASRDALRRRRTEEGGRDELLTVMSMKWKRRRDEKAQALAVSESFEGRTASGGGDSSSLAAGTVPVGGQRRPGRSLQSHVPQRAIAFVPRKLGVTRLSDGESVLDDLFVGYEFCVLYTSEETCTVAVETAGNRTALEKCLLRHGARVVANPGRTTSLLLASSPAAPKVANWVALCRTSPAKVAARYAGTDIVQCDWATACVAAGAVLPLAPRNVLYASPGLEAKFRVLFDPYEDSYYEPATTESLAYSMRQARARRLAEPVDLPPPGGGGAEPPALSLSAEANRAYRLRAELGIIPAGAMRLAAVRINEPSPAPLSTARLHASLGLSSGARGSTEPPIGPVTDSLAEYVLLGCGSQGPTPQAKVKTEKHSSAIVKPEPLTDNDSLCNSLLIGASFPQLDLATERDTQMWSFSHPSLERNIAAEGTDVQRRHCTVLRTEAEWSVPQLLAMVKIIRECACAVESCLLSEATHAIDQEGRLRALLKP